MKSYKPYLSYKKDLDKGKMSLADIIKDNCPYDDLTDEQQDEWISAILNYKLDENGVER